MDTASDALAARETHHPSLNSHAVPPAGCLEFLDHPYSIGAANLLFMSHAHSALELPRCRPTSHAR